MERHLEKLETFKSTKLKRNLVNPFSSYITDQPEPVEKVGDESQRQETASPQI